jgi:hypothetical protein
MRDKLPLGIMILMGIFGITAYFIPYPTVDTFNEYLRNTLLRIISAFALILGLGNLIQHHIGRIKRKGVNWHQSYTLLIALGVTAFVGLCGGVSGTGWFPTKLGGFQYDVQTQYMKVLTPLGASMFSLLAFYMASAAYRSFRAKNVLAFLLLAAAFVVMLGQVPFGQALWSQIPEISQRIMSVPNTASKRGIELGVTLGALATSLKILTGIERSWMGGGK